MRVAADGKVHRTKAEWAEIFARFEKSGLSREEFCRNESIQPVSFGRWYSKLRKPLRTPATPKSKANSQPEKESFVEIAAPTPELSPWVVELELPGGCVLRLRS